MKEKDKKKYFVSEETRLLHDEYVACENLKNKLLGSIKFYMTHKRVIKLAIRAQTKKRQFWNRVFDEHPGLNADNYIYHPNEGYVEVKLPD